MRRCRALLALPLLLSVLVAAPAAAQPASDRVRDFFGSVNRLLADPAFEDRPLERLAAMRGLVVTMIEFREAAALALGAEWSSRSPAEREEFVRLFSDLLQASVFSSVGARARLDNGLSVTYIGELEDRGGVTVATTILTRSGAEMAVGYRMVSRAERWMIYDVVIEGVSLVDNYRAQFQKVMQRASYAGLVAEMRTRLTELGRATAPAPVPVSPAVIVAADVTTVAAPPPPEPSPIAARDEDGPAPAPATPMVSARPAPARESAAPVGTSGRRVAGRSAYWVQIGAFRTTEAATKLASAFRDQAVSLLAGPGQPLLRVVVGPFASRDGAAAKLREIRARGYDGFVAELVR